MIVKVDMDPRVLWQVEARAEKLGLSFSAYVCQLVGERVAPAKGFETRDQVVRLHGEGLSDEAIAERVGRVVGHVARLRRAAGLKRNEVLV